MAVVSKSLTCTVISVDDGLLRTSTGCAGPASSVKLYADWSNATVIAIRGSRHCSCTGMSLFRFFIVIVIVVVILLYTVSSTEGLTATCAAAFELS